MNARTLTSLAVALALVVGGFLFYRDYEYRQIHGTVTQVSLVTWEQEVIRTQDKTPVLVYFYKDNEKNPADAAQAKEVADFAWRNAGKVKVVSVNVAHIENLPLAIAHGALRQPGFVVISGDDIFAGPSGVFASKEDLARLIHGAHSQHEKQKP